MAVRKPETFQPLKGSQDPPIPAPNTKDAAIATAAAIQGTTGILGGGEQIGGDLDKFVATLQGGGQETPQEAPQGQLTPQELASPIVQQAMAAGATEADIIAARPTDFYGNPVLGSSALTSNLTQLIIGLQRVQQDQGTAGSFATQEEALAMIAQQGATGQAIPVIREDGTYSIKQLSQAELKANEERAPRDMQELITQQLTEGNFDAAIAFDDVLKRPSAMDALQVAMEFVSSPADVFTLSAIASGALDRGPSTLGEVNPLPRSPLLQQLFDKAMGQALGQVDSFGFPEQQKAAPQPAPAPGPVPVPPTQPAPTPQTGGVGLVGQQDIAAPTQPGVAAPTSQQIAQPTGFQPIDRSGTAPGQGFTGVGGRFFDPNLQGAAPGQDFMVGVDQPPAFNRQVTLPQQPTAAPQQTLIPPIQPQQGITDFAPPQGVAPIVPPGVPQGSIQFGGKDLPIPIGLQSLFEGGTGGVVEKRRSLLAEAGLPILSAQAQRRLLPAELEAFKGIAQTAGIPLPQINKELGATRPGGSRRRKISSAGV